MIKKVSILTILCIFILVNSIFAATDSSNTTSSSNLNVTYSDNVSDYQTQNITLSDGTMVAGEKLAALGGSSKGTEYLMNTVRLGGYRLKLYDGDGNLLSVWNGGAKFCDIYPDQIFNATWDATREKAKSITIAKKPEYRIC